jgi:hypothetical protein
MKTFFTTAFLACGLLFSFTAQAQRLNSQAYGNYAVDIDKNSHLSQTRAGSSALESLKSNEYVLVVYNAEGQDYVAIYRMAHDQENPTGIYPAKPGPNNTIIYTDEMQIQGENGLRTEVTEHVAQYSNGELTVKSFLMGRDVVFYKYD